MATSGTEFAHAEYHEAANAYFKGVDIGYTTVRGYITINVLFGALVGAVASPGSNAIVSATDILKYIPWFAGSVSLVLLFALPYYFRHLENCRLRCEEIEREYGGKLFTRLGKIAHARTGFNTVIGLVLITFSVAGFWLFFGIKVNNPNFDLLNWLDQQLRLLKG